MSNSLHTERRGATTPFRAGPQHPERAVLRDPELDAILRERGYVVIDLFDPAQIDEMRAAVDDIYRGERTGQHYTLLIADQEYRDAVFALAPELLGPAADEIFDDYRYCGAALAYKWPGPDSTLGAHQDISIVDETRFRSYNIWVPLSDTDESNGAIRFLPGSHRLLDNLRTMPGKPDSFGFEAEQVPLDAMEIVPTRKGQAIVFDHATLHGSGDNLSDEVRPALTGGYRPAESTLRHYFVGAQDQAQVEVYEVPDDFYRVQLVGDRPTLPGGTTMSFYGTERTVDEIVQATSRRRIEEQRRERLAGVEMPGTPMVDGAVERTFLDESVEQQMVRDGYVVIDLLDAEQIESLRVAVDELYRSDRKGFHASNICNDHEYRRLVNDRVGPVLVDALRTHLDRQRLCVALATMKFPDEESGLVVHQEWSMVDESRYRGVNVWCPLVDTTTDNGALRVLPGSHRRLPAWRCDPDYPESYDAPGTKVRWDQMVPMEVRAGQAVVFDHRTLHGSGPNASEQVRPAVVAVMAPEAAQLYHWFRPEPDATRLEVMAVDLDFFIEYEIGVKAPWPTIGDVDFVGDRTTPDELVQYARSLSNQSEHPGRSRRQLTGRLRRLRRRTARAVGR